MLATVFACDSLNQSFSQMWGLVAICVYLTHNGKWRHPLWLLCVLLAAFSKENGLAWAVVPPILAYGFQRIDRKTLLRHLGFGIALAVVYGLIRLSVPSTEVYYEEYHSYFDVAKKAKSIAILLCYTFLPGDYIYLIHAPSRHIPLFLLTLLPTLPFLWMVFFSRLATLLHRHFLTLALCALIAVSPNLLITMSMMNAYAWLAMASLAVGVGVHHCQRQQRLLVAFCIYLCAVVFTCLHHWYGTWQTSLPARYMAQEAIEKTGCRADKVYVITIEETDQKFSSFVTLPTEAFGWGRAVWGLTAFEWPLEINDTIVPPATSTESIDSLARQALSSGHDCVWVVNKDHVHVIK